MLASRSLVRRASLVAATATAALVLAACGGNGEQGHNGHDASAKPSATASAEAGAHNDQDVDFAQGMIPHHRQAVEMSDMAADRAGSDKVKALAERIKKAQDPEIDTMSGWLKAWGEDVPAGKGHEGMDHGDMDHGGSGMPGMMSDKDMEKMSKASGKDFDTMFLTMMIEHHKGAVEMSETEKNKGKYGPAKKLADDIITAQQAEITEMNKLLGKE